MKRPWTIRPLSGVVAVFAVAAFGSWSTYEAQPELECYRRGYVDRYPGETRDVITMADGRYAYC